jgi:tRNA (cytidine/uridine-2'-O-)-methyltransferase
METVRDGLQGGLPAHRLKIVLVEPEIPQNTGNIARLCAATGVELHLVRPLGFFLSDKHFKRAGMDYLVNVPMTVHDSLGALMERAGAGPVVLSSGVGGRDLWEMGVTSDTWIFLGKESAGLPGELLEKHAERVVRIPMVEGTRGLNVSTAAGILVYEALRQLRG